jgi:hypothetical protein
MNNFVFGGSDPLLYNTMSSNIQRQLPPDMDVRQQLDNAMAQYQQAQQNLLNKQPIQYHEKENKDYLGELDDMVKELDDDVMLRLQNNEEFVTLNAEIQQMIQDEIMKSVRNKINANPEAISKIETLKKTIKNAQKEQQAEEKRSMMELNDYITNYSSMSFDEYKRIKSLK